jgi:hypothetical protein
MEKAPKQLGWSLDGYFFSMWFSHRT